jgi:hypothetical protein
MTNIKNRAIAFGLAGALAIGLSATAFAGPMPVNPGVKNAPVGQVTEVRWRGGGRGFGPAVGIGAGIAAGALIGSAVAGGGYGPGYYYDQPVYGAPVYAQPYGYEQGYPAQQYYAPSYGYGQCYTDEGYGRRTPCDAGR